MTFINVIMKVWSETLHFLAFWHRPYKPSVSSDIKNCCVTVHKTMENIQDFLTLRQPDTQWFRA